MGSKAYGVILPLIPTVHNGFSKVSTVDVGLTFARHVLKYRLFQKRMNHLQNFLYVCFAYLEFDNEISLGNILARSLRIG